MNNLPYKYIPTEVQYRFLTASRVKVGRFNQIDVSNQGVNLTDIFMMNC